MSAFGLARNLQAACAVARSFLGANKSRKIVIDDESDSRSCLVRSAQAFLLAADGDPTATTMLLEAMESQAPTTADSPSPAGGPGSGATWLAVFCGLLLQHSLELVEGQGVPYEHVRSGVLQAVSECCEAIRQCAVELHLVAERWDEENLLVYSQAVSALVLEQGEGAHGAVTAGTCTAKPVLRAAAEEGTRCVEATTTAVHVWGPTDLAATAAATQISPACVGSMDLCSTGSPLPETAAAASCAAGAAEETAPAAAGAPAAATGLTGPPSPLQPRRLQQHRGVCDPPRSKVQGDTQAGGEKNRTRAQSQTQNMFTSPGGAAAGAGGAAGQQHGGKAGEGEDEFGWFDEMMAAAEMPAAARLTGAAAAGDVKAPPLRGPTAEESGAAGTSTIPQQRSAGGSAAPKATLRSSTAAEPAWIQGGRKAGRCGGGAAETEGGGEGGNLDAADDVDDDGFGWFESYDTTAVAAAAAAIAAGTTGGQDPQRRTTAEAGPTGRSPPVLFGSLIGKNSEDEGGSSSSNSNSGGCANAVGCGAIKSGNSSSSGSGSFYDAAGLALAMAELQEEAKLGTLEDAASWFFNEGELAVERDARGQRRELRRLGQRLEGMLAPAEVGAGRPVAGGPAAGALLAAAGARERHSGGSGALLGASPAKPKNQGVYPQQSRGQALPELHPDEVEVEVWPEAPPMQELMPMTAECRTLGSGGGSDGTVSCLGGAGCSSGNSGGRCDDGRTAQTATGPSSRVVAAAPDLVGPAHESDPMPAGTRAHGALSSGGATAAARCDPSLTCLVYTAAAGLAHGHDHEMQLAAAAVLELLGPLVRQHGTATGGNPEPLREGLGGRGLAAAAASGLEAVAAAVCAAAAALQYDKCVLTAEVKGSTAEGMAGVARGVCIPLDSLTPLQASLASEFLAAHAASTSPLPPLPPPPPTGTRLSHPPLLSGTTPDTSHPDAALPRLSAVFFNGAIQPDHASRGPLIVSDAANLAAAGADARYEALAARLLVALQPHRFGSHADTQYPSQQQGREATARAPPVPPAGAPSPLDESYRLGKSHSAAQEHQLPSPQPPQPLQPLQPLQHEPQKPRGHHDPPKQQQPRQDALLRGGLPLLILVSGHVPDRLAALMYELSGGAVLTVGGVGLRAVRAAAAACGVGTAASLTFLTRRSIARGVSVGLAAAGLDERDYRTRAGGARGPDGASVPHAVSGVMLRLLAGHGSNREVGRSDPDDGPVGLGWVTVVLAHPVRSELEGQAVAVRTCFNRLVAALRTGRMLPGAGAWELATAEYLTMRARDLEQKQAVADATLPSPSPAAAGALPQPHQPWWMQSVAEVQAAAAAERALYDPLSYRAVAAALRDVVTVLLQNGGASGGGGRGYSEVVAAAAACADAWRDGDAGRLRWMAMGVLPGQKVREGPWGYGEMGNEGGELAAALAAMMELKGSGVAAVEAVVGAGASGQGLGRSWVATKRQAESWVLVLDELGAREAALRGACHLALLAASVDGVIVNR